MTRDDDHTPALSEDARGAGLRQYLPAVQSCLELALYCYGVQCPGLLNPCTLSEISLQRAQCRHNVAWMLYVGLKRDRVYTYVTASRYRSIALNSMHRC